MRRCSHGRWRLSNHSLPSPAPSFLCRSTSSSAWQATQFTNQWLPCFLSCLDRICKFALLLYRSPHRALGFRLSTCHPRCTADLPVENLGFIPLSMGRRAVAIGLVLVLGFGLGLLASISIPPHLIISLKGSACMGRSSTVHVCHLMEAGHSHIHSATSVQR